MKIVLRSFKHEYKTKESTYYIALCVSRSGSAIIIFVLIVYAIHSHIHWLGEIDKDFFGIFGEFIGGVVGTLFSIATTILVYLTYNAQQKDVSETRKLLQKQIELSIKPDLFFTNSSFYGFSRISEDGKGYAVDFSNNPKANIESFNYTVHVDLVNIGIGVAKNIEYYWDFELSEAQEYLEGNFKQNPLKISDFEKDVVEFKIDGIKNSVNFRQLIYKMKRRFDILLSHQESSTKLQVLFRLPYLTCYFIAVSQSFFEKTKNLNTFLALDDFPTCKLHLSYQDISERVHKKTFDFQLQAHGSFLPEPDVEGQKMFGYDLYALEV